MDTTELESEASALFEFRKNIIQINDTLGKLSALSDWRDSSPEDKIFSWITSTFDGLKRLIPPLRETYSLKSAAWFNKDTVFTHATINGRTWTDIVLKAAESALTSSEPFDFLPSNHELQHTPLHGCQFLAKNGYASTQIEPHLEIEFECANRTMSGASRTVTVAEISYRLGILPTSIPQNKKQQWGLPVRGGGNNPEEWILGKLLPILIEQWPKKEAELLKL